MATVSADYEPSRRYRSAAAYYLAGRPAYAALLIRRVAALVGLQRQDAAPGLQRQDAVPGSRRQDAVPGSRRQDAMAGLRRQDAVPGSQRQDAVLDLGCGPGVLARAFAPLAGEVAAMDPEPEMLRVAAEACAGIANIRFVAGGSNDLAPSLGWFRLVVMGRSFHWMDRAPTLRALDALVEPGGAVVLFHTGHARVPGNAWAERFRDLRRRYGGETGERPGPNAAASDVAWVRHEAFMLASPFRCVEGHSVLEEGKIDAARLIDRAFSMSGTAPDRLGDRAADLERDIVALVRDIAPDGRLTEVIKSSALIARRPGEEDAV